MNRYMDMLEFRTIYILNYTLEISSMKISPLDFSVSILDLILL